MKNVYNSVGFFLKHIYKIVQSSPLPNSRIFFYHSPKKLHPQWQSFSTLPFPQLSNHEFLFVSMDVPILDFKYIEVES